MGWFKCFGGAKDRERLKQRSNQSSPQRQRIFLTQRNRDQNVLQESTKIAERSVEETITAPLDPKSLTEHELVEQELSPSPSQNLSPHRQRNRDQNLLQQENTTIAQRSVEETVTASLNPNSLTEPEPVEQELSPSPSQNLSPHRQRNRDQNLLQQENTTIAQRSVEETVTASLNPNSLTEHETMEQQQSSTPSPKKSVTFNSNTTYKHISVHGSSDSLPAQIEKGNQENNSGTSSAAANFESPRAPFSLESTFKEKPDQLKNTNQGIAVDTSLSTSLGSPEIISSKKSLPMIYGFKHLIKAGLPISSDGAFRDNIRQFLLKCAKLQDYDLNGMSVWRTSLVYENKGEIMPLYIIEEDVKQSDSPFCDYCRLAGWRHHLMSKKKYHLIIPENCEWNNLLDEGVFHLQSHLLHGLIHTNGYGHLICINGIEGGSEFIRGKEIMDLWDCICTSLHVRKISVNDLSRKDNMDLRILYGVSFGKSWFGRWDYQYSHGRFEVKEDDYERAMNTLSSTELDEVIEDFSLTNEGLIIEQIIRHYRGISDTNLVTFRDLFSFMLNREKENRSGKENTTRYGKFSNLAMEPSSMLSIERFEHAAQVIVDALKEKSRAYKASSSKMTRKELRDFARIHIDNTELIDRVLRVMNNVIVGNCIVRSVVNRHSKLQEYTVQYINNGGIKDSLSAEAPVITTTSPGQSIPGDIIYFYKNVLCACPEPDSVNPPLQMILFSRNFVKEFPLRVEGDESLWFTCRLTRSSIDVIDNDFRGFQPGESVTVPVNATVGDLKIAVQKAMRETYCVTEELRVSEILGLEEGVQDADGVKGLVESGKEIWFKCCGLDLESAMRFQGRKETEVVNCDCGTQEHDGERMVACNQCEVWRHTRCSCLDDEENVPLLFTCDLCSCAYSSDSIPGDGMKSGQGDLCK